MSGIVGILHLDGQPADHGLIEQMTASLAFRGPDAQQIWIGGPVAFGHTMLRTTFEAKHEAQPHTLDGQVWITADARIDARENLARELGLPQSALARPDCELILHAYARWGETCVDHLLGDFAFAIWDARARKLFCARDHFGIKPFYYAHIGNTFVFSNTLDCVRLHPAISDELNELAIADFLIFDFNQDAATTTFADIRRLPPAHVLIATAAGISVRRYWSLPEGGRIRHRRTRDYVEHFRALLEAATADRLRTDRVGIMMSGGLDSPSVAALARKARPETELRAYTIVYDSLMPDDERHYSTLVAHALGCPIEHSSMDSARPFEPVPEISTPEPIIYPFWAFDLAHTRRVASNSPVVLTGLGADPLTCLSPLLNCSSIGAIPPIQTAANFLRYSLESRTVPKIRLRSTVRHLLGLAAPDTVEVPAWLNHGFAQRCAVVERAIGYSAPKPTSGVRPYARYYLKSAFWPHVFDTQDASWLSTPVEYRHPFFDLRLAQYFLSIPELPYSMDKWLLRMALRGLLPDSVRLRPKTPLRGNPLQAALSRNGLGIVQPICQRPQTDDFIDPWSFPTLRVGDSVDRLWVNSRAISLNIWLYSQEDKIICKTTTSKSNSRPTNLRNYGSMEM